MPSLNVELCAIQSQYLDREEYLMRLNPRVSHQQLVEIIMADPVCRRLRREEQELLSPTIEETEKLFDDPCSSREWDRRKKYRGKSDGAKQPNKVRIARRRHAARRKMSMFN